MAHSPMRFILGGRVHARRGTQFRPHAHACHELVVPLRGRLQVRIGGASTTAGPGELLWFAAGGEHFESIPPTGSADWLYLQIDGSIDGPISAEKGGEWPLHHRDRHGTVRQLAGLILAEVGTSEVAQRKRDYLAGAVIAELALASELGAVNDDLIVLAHQFIRRHLAEPLPIERLARACGLSRAHFARRWKTLTGATVQTTVRNLRLARARELLQTSDQPLHSIAPTVGIASGHLLSRLLARHLGCGVRALRMAGRPISYT